MTTITRARGSPLSFPSSSSSPSSIEHPTSTNKQQAPAVEFSRWHLNLRRSVPRPIPQHPPRWLPYSACATVGHASDASATASGATVIGSCGAAPASGSTVGVSSATAGASSATVRASGAAVGAKVGGSCKSVTATGTTLGGSGAAVAASGATAGDARGAVAASPRHRHGGWHTRLSAASSTPTCPLRRDRRPRCSNDRMLNRSYGIEGLTRACNASVCSEP